MELKVLAENKKNMEWETIDVICYRINLLKVS